MLEKEVGHPVSPKDNRDDTSLNPNPKEADDIRSEYITLFSLPASPDQPPMGAPRCQESLLGGGAQQAIPSHLSSLRKAGESNSQPGETVGPRSGLWSGLGLDSLSVPENHLFSLSADSPRRTRSLRSLPAGDQETGALCFRTGKDHDRPRSLSPSGTGLENSQGHRPAVPGERLWADRLSRASHPGHRRSLGPQRSPLPDGGSRLRDRAGGLDWPRPQSPNPEEIFLGHEPGAKAESGSRFAKTLCRYRYGILNHCDYPIHTGKLEGVNNKIKVIKRKAYGFHDFRYFSLKIIQAFAN